MNHMRLDVYLTEHNLASSRHRAQEMIRRGFVAINGKVSTKASRNVTGSDIVTTTDDLHFVSRAGDKLAFALERFGINPSGMTCLDIGSSTGGFTDCLLKNGATNVVAVDVGTDQLHHTLRNDPRVELHEQTDIRAYFPRQQFELVVCDVSFISLNEIIPELPRFLATGGIAIVLIKPQFEVAHNERTKSGIVKESVSIDAIFAKITNAVTEHNMRVVGDFELVPIKGGDGNQEYIGMIQN